MTAAQLTYTCTPTQVAISTSGSGSQVGITFLVGNGGKAAVAIEQIVFTLPQGDGGTDLMAPGSSFLPGSVHSSNGAAWSLTSAGNQAILMPVAASGFATLAVGDSLRFTLSALTVNAAGAGQSAAIGVLESLHDGGNGTATIAIAKVEAGFRIEAFTLDQYNLAPGSPVTVTWKVIGALSCEVEAKVIQVVDRAARQGPGCGIGTANPACDGIISTGSVLAGTNTCNVQGVTEFTLTARGQAAGGDVCLTSQLLVTVNEPAINFTGFPPVINLGQSLGVDWISADAGKLQLYVVPSKGEPEIIDITATPVGNRAFTPALNTSYYLYAFARASDPRPRKQGECAVTVEVPQWNSALAASDVPAPAFPGDTATLDWSVLHVDHCRLSCDQPGFAPQDKLPNSGPLKVTLPDPGVDSATATFTLTPVQCGTLGDFTPTTTAVQITQLHFSQPLAADPASVAPGGTFNLSWAVARADTLTLTSNLPGSTPISVDPSATSQAMVLPVSLLLPVPVTYTITAARKGQTKTATSSTVVQGTGQTSRAKCVWNVEDVGGSYIGSLFCAHPNKRISQVQLQYNDHDGISVIDLWYGTTGAPDYSIARSGAGAAAVGDNASTLVIAPGDYLVDAFALFTNDEFQYETLGLMKYLKLTTQAGQSIELGTQQGDQQVTAAAPPGQQVIALDWGFEYGALRGIALVNCPVAYGQATHRIGSDRRRP